MLNKNSFLIYKRTSPVKENLLSIAKPDLDTHSKYSKGSKIKNRRYYHTNNFTTSSNDSSIIQVIKKQKEYLETK
jgi:hypothetical protein